MAMPLVLACFLLFQAILLTVHLVTGRFQLLPEHASCQFSQSGTNKNNRIATY